ncbi:hypothetical protein PLESTB_001493100 [Pleodorina starrii]|uniref:Uncharacterized protein n=1 Tax=Pleodorina starrii TaxID=330485 RepID=A0A9W6BWF6_9CHLO|nr:hypothetical protein PLESTM_001451300 [Pleodorina starrii]GLC59492.1 hypothetical protein PLESTB_001493100 [Pleodorina starrii]GLC66306.1 hypothetical protein PLESTF_000409800 [Pleodorina starrii]
MLMEPGLDDADPFVLEDELEPTLDDILESWRAEVAADDAMAAVARRAFGLKPEPGRSPVWAVSVAKGHEPHRVGRHAIAPGPRRRAGGAVAAAAAAGIRRAGGIKQEPGLGGEWAEGG